MGFSFLTLALIRAALPKAEWAPLVAGFGYTIGFLIAVLGRQQLFTGEHPDGGATVPHAT